MQSFILIFLHSCLYSSLHSFLYSPTHSFLQSPIHSSLHPYIQSFILIFILTFILTSYIHLYIHLNSLYIHDNIRYSVLYSLIHFWTLQLIIWYKQYTMIGLGFICRRSKAHFQILQSLFIHPFMIFIFIPRIAFSALY